MARYPGTERERRIEPDRLKRQVAGIFAGCGMRDVDASLLADSLVRADIRGIQSHGVLRVPDYVAKLTRESVNPRGRAREVSRTGGTIVVDGDNSMGQIAGAFAMRRAIECARETGVAAAAVRGSNHAGAMDYCVRLAVDENMIGLATTNALPTMAPWGGMDKVIGLNPIGIGVRAPCTGRSRVAGRGAQSRCGHSPERCDPGRHSQSSSRGRGARYSRQLNGGGCRRCGRRPPVVSHARGRSRRHWSAAASSSAANLPSRPGRSS